MELTIKFYSEKAFGTVSSAGLHLKNPTQSDLDSAVEKISKDGFDSVHIYSDKWSELRAWSRPDSYMGPQYWGYVSVCGRSRDSSLVERANWESITSELESKLSGETAIGGDSFPVYETAGASHWAVGWVETAMVYWANAVALDLAAGIRAALDDYPIYDDSVYSEMECDEQAETYKNNSSYFYESIICYLAGKERCPCDVRESYEKKYGSKAFDAVAWRLYMTDCAQSSTKDAWVRTEDIPHHVKYERYELTELARNGNLLARALMRKAGVPLVKKVVAK